LTDAVFVVAFSRDDGFLFTGSSSLFRASPNAAARCNAGSYNGNLWIAAHKSSTFPWALQVELRQQNRFLLTLITGWNPTNANTCPIAIPGQTALRPTPGTVRHLSVDTFRRIRAVSFLL
jgi:hypothetical protein